MNSEQQKQQATQDAEAAATETAEREQMLRQGLAAASGASASRLEQSQGLVNFGEPVLAGRTPVMMTRENAEQPVQSHDAATAQAQEQRRQTARQRIAEHNDHESYQLLQEQAAQTAAAQQSPTAAQQQAQAQQATPEFVAQTADSVRERVRKSRRLSIDNVHERLARVRKEAAKAVIGQEHIVEQILIAMLAGGHVLVEGVPGLGKTLIVKALSKTFGGEFSRVQFTPDLMPADVTGHMFFNPKEGMFILRRGPIFTNMLLADEINRAPAKTQSSLLEVMQERQVTIEGRSLAVDKPFMVLATQNPADQEGTYPLPEAQMDRFLMKVHIEQLDKETEVRLMRHILSLNTVMDINTESVSQVMTPDELIQAQQMVNGIIIDERVVNYAVDIVRLTREFAGIDDGAGPRGTIALLACARAKALLARRDHVIPDDIKALALPVLRHRVSLTAEVEIEGLSADQVLMQLLDAIDAPRQ